MIHLVTSPYVDHIDMNDYHHVFICKMSRPSAVVGCVQSLDVAGIPPAWYHLGWQRQVETGEEDDDDDCIRIDSDEMR